jgi:uncharacterized protein involved in type VI secretion and phage assembly
MSYDQQSQKHMVTAVEGRYYGKYRARVHATTDPLNRGRLQVIVNGIFGENPIWALPCVPYAGANVGMFFLPEEGTNVWVEFEGGDVHYPIWTGCFWNTGELTPGSMVGRRFIKTKEFTLEIDDDAGTLTLEANGGGAQIVLTRNQVQIKAASDITSTVGGRKAKLNVQKFDVNDGAFEVT